MQFSIKTMMIAIAIVAICLVMPGILGQLVYGAVWCVIPAALVTTIVYGNEEHRAFGTAALATFLVVTFAKTTSLVPFGIIYIGAAGMIGVSLRRHLQSETISTPTPTPTPTPPPPPTPGESPSDVNSKS